MKRYISLDKKFVLRCSVSKTILHDLRTGAVFNLFKDQEDFIRLLNGTRTLQEIRSVYSIKSKREMDSFVKELQEIGATCFTGFPNKRIFTRDKVPERRLESVHLESSAVCNMNCVHCYQGELIKKKVRLHKTEILSLLDQIQDLQVNNIGISGGEPLMIADIFNILDEIEKRSIRISAFFTNGLIINDDFLNKVKSLTSIFPIFISLDSFPGSSMSFRGLPRGKERDILSTIVNNIIKVVVFGIPVTINTVVNTENIDLLPSMYDFMISNGVKNWRLGFPKPTSSFRMRGKSFALDWKIIAEKCLLILEKHLKNGRPFNLQIEYLFRESLFKQGLPILSNNDYVCDYEGRRSECCIKPNGDVVSCAYCTEIPIGNIHKTSLRNIWYSKSMQNIKEIQINDVRECKDCDLQYLCGTGCRANAFFLHGDFKNSKDDYACEAVSFFKEKVMPMLKTYGLLK